MYRLLREWSLPRTTCIEGEKYEEPSSLLYLLHDAMDEDKDFDATVYFFRIMQLLHRIDSIPEVSNMSGFSDCSRFFSVFKERFGVTPYRYRLDIKKLEK